MTPSEITPVFVSHYSLAESLLTLEEAGKAKAGNPVSVFDLSQSVGLKEVVLCDSRIDSFIPAYKVATRLDIKLCYGIKLVVVSDMKDKDISTRRSESKVIVMIKGGPLNEAYLPQGYSDLIRIWNRAWGHEGHVTYRVAGEELAYGRIDWSTLKELWTENLLMVWPFFSSPLARNTLTFAQITPDPPVKPWCFREVDSGLPFAGLLDAALDRYVATDPELAAQVVPCKTVYYSSAADMRAYVTLVADGMGGTFDEPKRDHLHSDRFSFEDYKRLAGLIS